ncbi:type I restriction enzyme HsdR N-terminal domain-containing protein [Robertmurraya sp. GLU-23]
MINLDLYKSVRVYKRNRKKYIYDPIRKKLILQTPEELVRQKFVQYLIHEKNVPKELIGIEVPMSYFDHKASGRADIIVYTTDQNDSLVPILIVECKSEITPLIDDVFNQVYDYEDVIYADTIAVTNGVELFVESWNEKQDQYLPLEELPDYVSLVTKMNYRYTKQEPYVYKRRKIEDFNKKDVLEFYQNRFLGITDEKLYSFIINLNELFWDDSVKIPYKELYGIKYVNDLGVRFTKFGNASGYDWTGDYRSFIVEDKKGSNQIISLAILGGYLIVAIDNDKYSHNSLQLFIQNFVEVKGNNVEVFHNGRLTLGKSGMVKYSEILDYVEEKAPGLVINPRKIDLGYLDNSKQFDWEQEDVRNFIGRLVKYAIIRDDFREQKRKQLAKSKKRSLSKKL